MEILSPTARAWAEIDLGALRHNFEYVKTQAGKPVMCVVKADAYGHGAARCGLYLQALGADAFAVACLAEALALREAGIVRPILILGYTAPAYAALLARHGLIQTVQGEETALALSEAAQKAGGPVAVHLKIDTGMNRTGIFAQTPASCAAAAAEAARIFALPGLRVEGLYMHFSAADDPAEDAYTNWQLANFTAVVQALKAMGLDPGLCHASSSAALLGHPEAGLDMVRVGVVLYGLYPDSQPHPGGPLRPVMALKARVAQVRDLPAGASVSYGRAYKAARPIRIAAVAAGYADGLPRRLSNQGYDRIGGKPYPQIGRICMDMHMVDVTGAPSIAPGDEAVLWGGQGMCAEEAAQIVGTINYELTCLVTQRANRVYVE